MDEINGLQIPDCLTCGAHSWVECTCTGIAQKHFEYWRDHPRARTRVLQLGRALRRFADWLWH